MIVKSKLTPLFYSTKGGHNELEHDLCIEVKCLILFSDYLVILQH